MGLKRLTVAVKHKALQKRVGDEGLSRLRDDLQETLPAEKRRSQTQPLSDVERVMASFSSSRPKPDGRSA